MTDPGISARLKELTGAREIALVTFDDGTIGIAGRWYTAVIVEAIDTPEALMEAARALMASRDRASNQLAIERGGECIANMVRPVTED